ncbi:MAG: GlsB/YeaQ/YmgE family stress response membrane protein [Betaproteobacteria bacterium]|nr:GlsB/YeaQ/YmgE family stress response membrane protein [Betaproteobacteria bacterium]
MEGGILWTILIGFVVGLLAKFLHPGKENMGLIMTTLLGIGGSLLASYVGQFLHWYQAGQVSGFIASVVGAIVLLVIYGMVKGKMGN